MATKIRDIGNENELDRLFNKNFILERCREGFVEVNEEKFCFAKYYRNFAEKINNFPIRDDDVLIAAHPKTGTTWMTEMVWIINNNFDYEGAKEVIQKRFGLIEGASVWDFNAAKDKTRGSVEPFHFMDTMKSPRCLKTHLPWSLLPQQIRSGSKNIKIITTLRDPKDVCISYYHYSQFLQDFKGNFEEYCELFLAGRVMFGPYWKQVLSYWNERHRPNILFIKYKDMIKDLPSIIRQVAKFLEKDITDEQVKRLTEHLSFRSMKNNKAVNYENLKKIIEKVDSTKLNYDFIRKGKDGGYKDTMSPELIKKFESWTEENLRGTDLTV